ncbi:FAD-dependent oxidoreductase [Sphingomonas naphthae]|uniref:FAD-dependent oxidoreductase n=1 Tax=Sphingomonas naphthae TaxID=1813468 RepID=A0ABY7THG3_9SPHN|nr:FAD-dependent oxidoreductase [Sphingomonas naphthae]WCT72147.1 FAD-dependent oxidoreductase [Sphingomonas naphthae]
MISTDIAIIGAGMAGASLAAAIGDAARVVLIEGEDRPGRHSTGRSAAFWSETYGGPAVQPLTRASGPWLEKPPAEYGGESFLHPRGELHLAGPGGGSALDALAADFAGMGVALEPVGRDQLEAILPGLRPGFDRALAEPTCRDIDVGALHAACLRVARQAGVTLLCDAPVRGLARQDGRWRIDTPAGPVNAAIVVNAAGAWASAVAAMAGAQPIAITPYRRTIVQLRIDPPAVPDMPLVMDARGGYYFKPEAGGRIWLSPHDETEVAAHDVAPEEIDMAVAIDRLEKVVDWKILAREHAWAGLRSFGPDRAPVYGFDGQAPGVFWCAGQGGFGIQTAPAAAAMAAALVLGRTMPGWLGGIDPDRYAPTRFGRDE